jgi:tetratricopeptide (TPR) repeat protein
MAWWVTERPVRVIRQAYESSDWAAAYRKAADHLRSDPNRQEVILYAARSASRLGRWSQAEKYYVQFSGELVLEDLRLRSSAALGLEQWSRAGELLERIVQQTPDDAEALMKLAAVRFKDGHDVEATEMAEKAAALLADTPSAAAAYGMLGAVHSVRGNRITAIGYLRKALELDPQGRTQFRPAVTVRLELANNLLLTGAAQEAEQELMRLLQEPGAERDRICYELGRARMAQGDRAAAEQHWRNALKENERHAASRVALGELELQRRNVTQAIAELEIAVQLEPRDSPARYALGRAYIQAGRIEQGRAEHQLARTLREESLQAQLGDRLLLNRPDSPETKVVLATREAARGNWLQAEHWALEAVRLDPSDARWRRVLDQVQKRQVPVAEVTQ